MRSESILRVRKRALRLSCRESRNFSLESLEDRRLLAAGDALVLDGVNDYLSVTPSPDLFPQDTMTLEAWIQRAGGDVCGTIIQGADDNAYSLRLCAGRVQFEVGQTTVAGDTLIPPNVWTHVAVTWEVNSRSRIYINGDLEAEAVANSSIPSDFSQLSIGANPGRLLSTEDFGGYIAELRLWNDVRTEAQVRRSMHTLIETPRPGLVANWSFSNGLTDIIGGHSVTASGDATVTGALNRPSPPAPPLPERTAFDENFNQLPDDRFGAAAVLVPDRNRVLLIGGAKADQNGTVTIYDRVDTVDAAAGATNQLATLPTQLLHAGAAYSPDQKSVYVFGGDTGATGDSFASTIYRIDPVFGQVTTLPVTLPQGMRAMAAVYHPGVKRIFLIGGETAESGFGATNLQTVYSFDPVSETLVNTSITLPAPLSHLAAVYSGATEGIYLFGGRPGLTGWSSSIYELQIDDDGSSGSVTLLQTQLPRLEFGASAVEDPISRLVYVVGGIEPRLLAFDPVEDRLWKTPIEFPSSLVKESSIGPFASVVYDTQNRHMLILGGAANRLFYSGRSDIWRIPLGDGPALPIGSWDVPGRLPTTSLLTAIDGDEDRVIFGTRTDGAFRYDADRSLEHYTPTELAGRNGSISINDVVYDFANDRIWLSTNRGAKRDSEGTITTYDEIDLGTDDVLTVDPVRSIIGTAGEGVKLLTPGIPNPLWRTYLPERWVGATARRDRDGELWLLAGIITPDATYPSYTLWRMTYSGGFIPIVETTDFGAPVGNGEALTGLAFDGNKNWWVSSTNGIAYIPAAETPDQSITNVLTPLIGASADDVDVDRDGRIWVAIRDDGTHSGGLVAYESTGPNSVSTEEYNWLNAPVGTNQPINSLVWDSSFSAVAAVDERIWAGRADGKLITVTQRWQQLNEKNNIDQMVIERVWTARGRTFLATEDSLHVLLPDGTTWDNRDDLRVHSVMSDQSGRIWIGSDNGVQIYQTDGWLPLTDFGGTAPAGAIHAIVQDQYGAIWIGGTEGLTILHDDQFLFTLDATNSGLPSSHVTSLLVDLDNRLWIGTPTGLARVDQGNLSVFTTTDGLADNSISDLVQLGSGEIAVSTANGLSLFTNNAFVSQTLPIDDDNLPLSVDELGRLWAGSAVRTGDEWQGYYWTNSGLRSSTVSDNATDHADRIWFSHAPDPGVSVRGGFLPPLKDSVPIITGLSPRFATAGETVQVEGGGFGENKSELSVTLGGAAVEILDVEDDRITVRLGTDNVTGSVTVNRAGRSTTLDDALEGGPAFCAVPTLSSFTPTGGTNGTLMVISGTNFDPDAQVAVGTNQFRSVVRVSPTELRTVVNPNDQDGTVWVANSCSNAQDNHPLSFNHIELSISDMELNQGLSFYQLVQEKPTLAQYYLRHDSPPRVGSGLNDTVEIDTVQITFTNANGNQATVTRSWPQKSAPSFSTNPTAVLKTDLSNSVNVASIYPPFDGLVSVETVLSNGGYPVSQTTEIAAFRENVRLGVLLIPIVPENLHVDDIADMKKQTNLGLEQLRKRIFPFGNVDFVWSSVIRRDDQFALDDVYNLYKIGHKFDDLREFRNEHGPEVTVAMGVVHPSLPTSDSRPGFALWPDVSEMLNLLLIDALDTACDIAAAVLTFGIAGTDACDLEIPLYVGWAVGDTSSSTGDPSRLFGHELGHTLGLVKPTTGNGSWTDNVTHSVNDELDGGECSSDNTTFNFNKSLYRQAGVSEPVVDPIAGTQFRAQNDGNPSTARGKAIMSYACARQNDNVFFEPSDYQGIAFQVLPFDQATQLPQAATEKDAAPTPQAAHEAPVGPRIRISGTIDAGELTGQIERAMLAPDTSHLSYSFATEYSLVQLNSSNTVLDQIGIFPYSPLINEDGGSTTIPEEDLPLFFAATMLRHEGLARLELRKGDTLLDSWQVGAAPPEVAITAPTGGQFETGEISLTWQASDSDGDPLRFFVSYSADNGQSWQPVDIVSEQNTLQIPVRELAGSDAARFRVTAHDGFHRTDAVSSPFTVAFQPPDVAITHPRPDGSFLEHTEILFTGDGFDNQAGTLDGQNMVWSSSRDGFLGYGRQIETNLSVGTHEITLTAINSVGQSVVDSLEISIQSDFDRDGLPDELELARGLNPLLTRDAMSDDDGDGLPLRMELARGSNPQLSDSDGDGRLDGQEILDGTHPQQADSPLPAGELEIRPLAIDQTINGELDTPLRQIPIQITSRTIVDWKVESNAEWLVPSVESGQTPEQVVIRVESYLLRDGIHEAELHFMSDDLNQSHVVPVTVRIVNAEGHFDVNRDGVVDDLDEQIITDLAGVVATDDSYNYRADIDRNGLINLQDLHLTQGTDLNRDGVVDANDPDYLCARIDAEDLQFDLNQDGSLDESDLVFYIRTMLGTHRGDANLNGSFNTADLVQVLQTGEYEDGVPFNSGWADGDWNCDREFDTQDLVVALQDGGYEFAAQPATLPLSRQLPVPAPDPTRHRHDSTGEMRTMDLASVAAAVDQLFLLSEDWGDRRERLRDPHSSKEDLPVDQRRLSRFADLFFLQPSRGAYAP